MTETNYTNLQLMQVVSSGGQICNLCIVVYSSGQIWN
jgi:hypothetical protein